MNRIKVVKFVLGVIVSAGTTKIVAGFVRNNVTPTSMRDKITIIAATTVIGSIVVHAVKAHADSMVDEVVAGWNQAKERLLEAQASLAGDS